MATPLPAVVTIFDLTLATTLSTSALFEAAQTTAGVAETVKVNLQQLLVAAASAVLTPDGLQVITTSGVSIASTSVAVQMNLSAAGSAVVPLSTTWRTATGRTILSITDISGSASLNNITINFSGGQTASGQSSLTIASDFGSWSIGPTSTGWVVVGI